MLIANVRKFRRPWAVLLLLLMVVSFVVSAPLPVFATPTEPYKPIEHLIVVSDTSWYLNELETALQNEEATDSGGSLNEYNGKEAEDHTFVHWGSSGWVQDVRDAVNTYKNPNSQSTCAVVFWMGFDHVDDVTTFTHDELVRTELSEYQKEMVEVTIIDPDSGTTITEQKEQNSNQLQYEYSIETVTCWKKAAQRYVDELRDNGLYDFLTNSKINSYWVGLPPNGSKDASGNFVSDYEEQKDLYTSLVDKDGNAKPLSALYGFWAKKWNDSLSSVGKFIDIWEAAADSKLYFVNNIHHLGDGYHGSNRHGGGSGTNSGIWTDADANHGLDPEETVEAEVGDHEYSESDALHACANTYVFYSYDEQTYQTLFHIILNQVRELNPSPLSGDAISQDLYSVSAALTAYVNNVLSPNADETHADHLLLDTGNVGNGGALLGYGDEDYGFVGDIVTTLSSTSSSVGYSALKDINGGQLDNTLQYARYGRLLADMGVDSYGVKHTFGSGRIIPGVFMLVVFSLSLMCSKLFGLFVDLMILLNPFRFFVNIGGIWGTHLTDAVDASNDGLSTMAHNLVNSRGFNTISEVMSTVYNGLTSWSWGLIIPAGLALMIASLFLYTRLFNNDNPQQRTKKLLTWLMRVAFVAIGIPMLGCIYTAVLDKLDYTTDDTKCASTQIVAATYVDFGSWVSELRLDPVSGGLFVSENTSTNEGGDASTETLAALRKTALAINSATGAVDSSIGSISATDELNWSTTALGTDADSSESAINQCYSLLTGYMSDNFYYPSDWESEVGSAISKNPSITTGRRQGGEEETFDTDAFQGENTVYNMFDETNEMEDWTGRDTADSSEIFTSNTKWRQFNIFMNGGNITSDSANSRKVSYSSSNSFSDSPTNPKEVGGLSTLSMYNYLSSKFNTDGVVMYSNANTANIQSKYSHYSVNSVGSGMLGVFYYLNAFILMLIVAIIGLFYVMASTMNILRKGVTVFTSIPGAALGVLKSISTIISTTFSMLVEIIMMGFMYTLISQLLMAFINILQNVMMGDVFGTSPVILGGVTASLDSLSSSRTLHTLMSSGVLLYLNLGLTTLVMFAGCVFLYKYKRAYQRATCFVRDKVYDMLLPVEVVAEMNRVTELVVLKNPLLRGKEYVASVVEILYNSMVETKTSNSFAG